MRNRIRNLTLSLLGLIHKPGNGIHILNGHYISKETKDADVFASLLSTLQKKVTYIRIEEATDLVKNRKTAKEPLVAFTFDDGYEECYTKIAPVLKQFKTNAAFFINPNFVECTEEYKKEFLTKRVKVANKEPMNWSMIKELANEGFVIGSHTMDHVRLNSNDPITLAYQIIDCKKTIQQKLGIPCEYFAYPYGQESDLSKEALQIAADNYQYLFTGFNHKNYFSFDNKAINRRHFEGDWSPLHMYYFLSYKKLY